MLLKEYLDELNKIIKKDNKTISLIDTNDNFVDIDYIINLVYDLDYEGLLYLRNVVEDLIKK